MAAVRLHFAAHGLDKKDQFGKSDPYIVLSRGGDDGEQQTVWRSPVVVQNLNPTWKAVVVPFVALFGSASPTEDDWEAPLELRVWDYDRIGDDDFIGVVRLTADWMRHNVGGTLPLTNPIKLAKAERRGTAYGNSGVVKMLAFDVVDATLPSDAAITAPGGEGAPGPPRSKPPAPAHPPPRGAVRGAARGGRGRSGQGGGRGGGGPSREDNARVASPPSALPPPAALRASHSVPATDQNPEGGRVPDEVEAGGEHTTTRTRTTTTTTTSATTHHDVMAGGEEAKEDPPYVTQHSLSVHCTTEAARLTPTLFFQSSCQHRLSTQGGRARAARAVRRDGARSRAPPASRLLV